MELSQIILFTDSHSAWIGLCFLVAVFVAFARERMPPVLLL